MPNNNNISNNKPSASVSAPESTSASASASSLSIFGDLMNTNKDKTKEDKCQQCFDHLTSILSTIDSKPKALFEAMGVNIANANSNTTNASTDTDANTDRSTAGAAAAGEATAAVTGNGIFWTMDENGKGVTLQIPKINKENKYEYHDTHTRHGRDLIQDGTGNSNSNVSLGLGFGGVSTTSNTPDSKSSSSSSSGTAMNLNENSIISENTNTNPIINTPSGNKNILQRMKTKLSKTFTKNLATSSINTNTNNNKSNGDGDGNDNDNDSITLEIQCRECGEVGPEGSARAFLRGPTPLTIILCTNRLSLQNSDEINEVLTHELIHVYDVHYRKWDFSNCQTLARSEIRAAREAECDDGRGYGHGWGSINTSANTPTSTLPFSGIFWNVNSCIKDKAKEATKNMFPRNGFDCVNRVFDEAMKDKVPFDTVPTATATATARKANAASTSATATASNRFSSTKVTADPMATIATTTTDGTNNGSVNTSVSTSISDSFSTSNLIHQTHTDDIDSIQSPIRQSEK